MATWDLTAAAVIIKRDCLEESGLLITPAAIMLSKMSECPFTIDDTSAANNRSFISEPSPRFFPIDLRIVSRQGQLRDLLKSQLSKEIRVTSYSTSARITGEAS
jgi:hypothetical protein